MTKTYICETCGKNYTHEVKTFSKASFIGNNCFDCSFWIEIAGWKQEGDPRQMIVNGTHYHIGEMSDENSFRGFGGCEFTIQFFDGRPPVTTDNLWCQGPIPKEFRDVLVDNARFCKECYLPKAPPKPPCYDFENERLKPYEWYFQYYNKLTKSLSARLVYFIYVYTNGGNDPSFCYRKLKEEHEDRECPTFCIKDEHEDGIPF